MRFIAIVGLAYFCSGLSGLGQELTQIAPPAAKKISDAASYGIGYDFGRDISSNGLSASDVSQADLVAGIMDALAGKEPSLQPDVVQAAMEALGKKIRDRKKSEADDFLEKNKIKEGVQTTPTGLQYQVLKSGNGAAPTAESTVTVHYEGKLTSGEVFDSSIQRGQPTSFGVSQVIPGWTQALLRMKVGDKWKLFIPPDLAYGERGSPPVIGPYETLIFDVELLDVK